MVLSEVTKSNEEEASRNDYVTVLVSSRYSWLRLVTSGYLVFPGFSVNDLNNT